MERRRLLVVTGASVLVVPRALSAQGTGKVPVVGILNTASATAGTWNPVLRSGLRQLGYVEDRTIFLAFRHANGRPEPLPRLAAELIQLNVDVLLAVGPAAVRAAKDAGSSIPIIAIDLESDPVRRGFIRSFARPGGNIAELFLDLPSLTSKWLELLKETVPGLARVLVLWDPTTGPYQADALRVVAGELGLELQVVEMFTQFRRGRGLLAYGPDQARFLRPLATYVDKILRSTKPVDLPVELPDQFKLVVNLSTAKALGLTIPQSVLLRADQVIE